jgi:GTP-binding protein EngB required for normal cell division
LELETKRADDSVLFLLGEKPMDNSIIQYFLTQGPFGVLFVWLLIYVMKNNKERENRLQDLLDKFSEKYDLVITKLDDIKEKIK